MQPGTRLGAYEIVSTLGAGGMGEVYRARDTRLYRDVAIKILPDAFAADRDRIARFTREAQALASLNHPHIAQIYDVATRVTTGVETGAMLVMELVEGETLADRITTGPIAIDDAVAIARQIAEALEAAHDAGIIHRDLKPANVKIRPDGVVKVLDFGLAKGGVAGGLPRSSENVANLPTITSPAMTHTGVILGTAAYMAPEQARGKAVDKRADIWAFGCVLYEMLTGKPPFPGETITDVIAAVVKNEPDWSRLPSDTPANLRRLLRRCLRKDPQERRRDIGDARLDLIDRDPIEPMVSTTRRGVPVWVAGSLVLAAAVAAGVFWPRPAPPSVTQWNASLVGTPATVLHARLSPDGQFLSFQTLIDGQSQLAVMRPGGGTWRVLTTDRTRGLITVHDWAPDGSRIFFDRQTDALIGVFSVPALGGDERLVVENAGYPVAMPNGDLLVQRVNTERQQQLHRFRPSSGQMEPLPAIPDIGNSDDAVVVSHDSRYAYFHGQTLVKTTAQPVFYRLDLQSKEIVPFPALSLRPPVSVAADPRTSDILVGGIEGDAFQIYRIAGGAPQTKLEAVLSIPDTARFDVGANGELYVVVRSRQAEIFAFAAGAGTSRIPLLLDSLPVVNSRLAQTLAPLPDGRFVVGSRGSNRDRVLVLGDKQEAVPLVDGDEETRAPVTAVGSQQAAVVMGAAASPDIAIVHIADGRLIRRFKSPAPTMTSLAASPDGRTLFYTAGGSVWSLPAEGGQPTRIGDGDSVTVELDSGDLIVKLDEGARIRLVRMKPTGATVTDIPVHSDLRLIQRALVPGAVRQGRMLLPLASADSWFWHAAVLDLKTGAVNTLVERTPSDFHFVTWRSDGVPVAFGYRLDTKLWRFTPRSQ
jgi:tRNA A-37 threonylcarbamoyl transferase component Bud32